LKRANNGPSEHQVSKQASDVMDWYRVKILQDWSENEVEDWSLVF